MTDRADKLAEITSDRPSALRYTCNHEAVLGNRYGRNRILIDLACQGKYILELGCADGFISRYLSERGCRVTGLEIDPEAAERARLWCERVVMYDLNRPDWTDQVGSGFDTVLCGDVLEHLVEPELALRQVHKILAPGARVLICLPNIAHFRIRLKLLAGKFDYESTGVLDVTHLRFYTYHTARKLIEGAGYRIIGYEPMVGGSILSHWFRALFHTLFARSMMFVAVPKQ